MSAHLLHIVLLKKLYFTTFNFWQMHNPCVCSVFTICESVEYFDHILHRNTCQHYLNTGMCNNLFDGQEFAEHFFSQLLPVSENAHNS